MSDDAKDAVIDVLVSLADDAEQLQEKLLNDIIVDSENIDQ